jgi:hypothetical protein
MSEDQDGEEILDWDAFIETPARPSGTIKVSLKYVGRAIPTLFEDPWGDA